MPTEAARERRARNIRRRIFHHRKQIKRLLALLRADRPKRQRGPNLSAEEKLAIVAAYKNTRLKVKTIAAQHGRSLSAIDTVIAEFGVPRRHNRKKNDEGQIVREDGSSARAQRPLWV